MSRTRQTDPELDSLIAEITIDCYDEDEALSAFENAFDEEVSFPIPAVVVGQEIKVQSIGTSDGRRELKAVLHSMAQDGELVDLRGARVGLPSRLNLVVGRLGIRQSGDGPFWDDEHVHGCLWLDVAKGQHQIIFIDNVRRDLPRDDFLK